MTKKLTRTLPDLHIVRTWITPVRADEPDGDEQASGLGTMVVRFSRFGEWYEINSWWEGRYLERVQRGAFAKTIKERAGQVKILYNHGYDFQIGDKILGQQTSLKEERDSPVGLVDLFDTTYNRDLLPGLRAGVYGSSFMFNVLSDSWDHEPDQADHNPEGLPERTITEVRLFEYGPVTWPANAGATAGMRCVSGTDTYYEALSRRDPARVGELRSRVTDLRTSAGESTEAAPGITTGPVDHPGGHSAAARSRRLALLDIDRRTQCLSRSYAPG